MMMLDCKQKYELRAKIVMSRSSTAETTSYVAIGHRIITSAVAQTVPKRRTRRPAWSAVADRYSARKTLLTASD